MKQEIYDTQLTLSNRRLGRCTSYLSIGSGGTILHMSEAGSLKYSPE
jgi:hypothetical protein